MRIERRSAVAAAIAAVAGMVAAPLVRAEDKAASLSLVNPGPGIVLNDLPIKRIVATLDGATFGRCNADRRQPGNVCIKATEIHSGPHVLEVLLDPLSSTYFTSVVKFTAGMTGDWVFDLKAMAVPDAKESDYLTVHERLAAVDGCVPALARVTTLSSCSLAGVGALAPALVEAAAACNRTARGDAAVNALSEIIDDHFGLTPGRCYTKAERKKLPGRLVDGYVGDDAWPENTLKSGSWAWARDVLTDLPSDADIATVLDKLQAALPELAKRVAVVDGVASAYLTGETAPVLQAAQTQSWSLDPATAPGHRNILLLVDPDRFADQAYGDFVAARVAADADLDCAQTPWEAELLVKYFAAGETLSPAAWKAVVAMTARVPADRGFGVCASAFEPSLRSSVTADERIHRFFELDCAETRSPKLRGQNVKLFVESDSSIFPGASLRQRKQVKEDFAWCVAAGVQTAAAAATASALKDAAERGCKIGPAAQCNSANLRNADLHGSDLHDAKFGEATLEKVNLQGANLQAADLHRATLDHAVLAGANLRDADLTEMYARDTDLHGLDFTGVGKMMKARLQKSDLHGSNFQRVALAGASLDDTNLEGANLQEVDLTGASLLRADLKRADLRGARLAHLSLRFADLRGADLRGIALEDVSLEDVNLEGADLEGVSLANIRVANATWMNGCKLAEAGKCAGIDLHSANLYTAHMTGIDLHGANLQEVRFAGSWLEKADLRGADLRGANLQTGMFRGANLEGANLEGAQIGDTDFGGANLSNAIWIDGHKCPAGTVGDRC
jgi:uncharacterized protein YjbI with pentapeptide repeats